jgi:hypothetical protein
VIWDKGRDKLPAITVSVVDTNKNGFYGEKVDDVSLRAKSPTDLRVKIPPL